MSVSAVPQSAVNGERSPEATFAESIIDTMRDPILVLNWDLHVLLASREFYRTFGVSREETEGRLIYELGNRQWDIPRLRTLLEEILTKQATFRDFEVEHVFETIGRKVMLLNARRLQQGAGTDENILLVIEDATDRRDAEEARREAETRFTEMVKNVRDHSIFLTDPDGVITSWNVAAERVIGYTEDEAVGKHFSIIFTPEDLRNGMPDTELRIARNEGRAEDERWQVRKDGGLFWALGIVTPLRDVNGRLTGFSKILRDMTERKHAEEAMRESEANLARVQRIGRVGGLDVDVAGGLSSRRSPEYLCLHGLPESAAEESHADWLARIHPDDREAAEKALFSALRSDAPIYESEYRIVRPLDGHERWIHARADIVRAPDGSPVRLVGAHVDVTEQKRTQDALRDSNERIGKLVALMPAAVYTCDAEGRLTFFNRRAAELWGREPRLGDDQEKFCGSFRMWAPDGPPLAHAECPMADAVREGRSVRGLEVVVERPDGSRVVVRVNIDPLRDREGRPAGAINVFEDVTDRKRSEEALRSSEMRLREIEERLQVALAAGQMGTWLWRIAQDEQIIDDSLRRLMGLPPGAEVMDLESFLQAIHVDDRDRARAEFERCVGGGDFNVEFRVTWPDGSIHWLRDQGKGFPSSDGGPLIMAGAAMDITERRRMEEDLRDADRRKDDFLALLAHELRNPLAPIRNGLQVLRLSEDRETRERSQAMMERQLTHMVRLIDDLLDVSRINRNKMELRRSRILLADAISSAFETARPMIESAGHELTIDLPPEPITLDADLTRLAQVFSNLLTNSAKYTERGGNITLAARLTGTEVVVTVSDNGMGIPSRSLPTIFDMFSQVDRSIERATGGLGIGLALVRGLVEMHGGTVTAASGGQDRGSVFTVRLPVVPVRSDRADAGEAPAEEVAPRRRILVVDDNRDSARSMGDMLRLSGNETATAHNGIDAVKLAEAFLPEVILMDVGMPRLNGLDATRRIREQPWGQKVTIIALTGWGQEGDRNRSKDAGCDGHLVKPVSLSDLEKMLHELSEPRQRGRVPRGCQSPAGHVSG